VARRDQTTLQERLDQLAERFGRHLTSERSLVLDSAQQQALMLRLREHPPAVVHGHAVTEVVDRPDGNVIKLQLGPVGRLFVRPSGTEPKVKLYCELVDHNPEPALDELAALLTRP
ncbi:MAG: pgm, partial [Acidimicrobiia bacterium]|nr:pgm [Acidimicrobiia bacterium]